MKQDTDEKTFKLADIIRQTAFAVHRYFRNGFLEKVYENSLAGRLRKMGISVEQQVALEVRDEDGSVVGEYVADLLVEGFVIVELKAAKTLDDNHTAQVLAYLRASQLNHGILINFGSPKLQVKKLVL